MVVPSGAGAGSVCPGTPPERVSRAPCSDPVSQLTISIWLTAAMAAQILGPQTVAANVAKGLEAGSRKLLGEAIRRIHENKSVNLLIKSPCNH